MRRTVFGVLAATALVAAACSSKNPTAAPTTAGSTGSGGSATSITVGSAGFTENIILANIYTEALKAKGITATLRPPIGERVTYIPAIEKGEIDLVPEYTGSLLSYYEKGATLTASAQVYKELMTKLPSSLTLLDSSAAQDQDAIVVTKATATKYNLSSIADLASVAGQLVLGGPAQFQTRSDGIPGLAKNYNVTFKSFKPLDVGGPLTVAALKNGQVQAADLFTTDPAILNNDFVILADPKSQFGAQNVVPLINKVKATPAVAAALDAVSAKLTTDGLTKLVSAVSVDKKDANAVAKQWLKDNGLS